MSIFLFLSFVLKFKTHSMMLEKICKNDMMHRWWFIIEHQEIHFLVFTVRHNNARKYIPRTICVARVRAMNIYGVCKVFRVHHNKHLVDPLSIERSVEPVCGLGGTPQSTTLRTMNIEIAYTFLCHFASRHFLRNSFCIAFVVVTFWFSFHWIVVELRSISISF